MNPYFFSTFMGGIGGGFLGYLICLPREAGLFGIISGVICGMLIGPGLLADIRRVEKDGLEQEYKRGYVQPTKK